MDHFKGGTSLPWRPGPHALGDRQALRRIARHLGLALIAQFDLEPPSPGTRGIRGHQALDGRMPVFNRQQKQHWTEADYVTVPAEGISSPTESQSCRIPRENSELEEYMIALVPTTSIAGFEIAIRALIPAAERADTLVLYNGFSTGGAFLWALSKQLPPDGIVGYGMSNFPIAYYWSKAATRKTGS